MYLVGTIKTNFWSPDRFSKSKTETKNFRIFRKTYLGNLAQMVNVKNQCHPKRRSMLNNVPNLTHCEKRLKFVNIKTSFQSIKHETKLLKFQSFSKKSPKEHYKNYMYQVAINWIGPQVKISPIQDKFSKSKI